MCMFVNKRVRNRIYWATAMRVNLGWNQWNISLKEQLYREHREEILTR
jgi:hypothetical protein